MLQTRNIPEVEILSVGTWHGSGCPVTGCEFTAADLDAMVADYESRKTSFQAPIKLGHDDDQKLLQADGYPAAGWLSNLRRKGNALLADLVKVPAKIADLIDVGAYANRSIELLDNRVTGLALLGADIPAVENLGDIAQWYSRVKLAMPDDGARAVLFASHPMVNGTHSHAHPAYDAQGGDATHTHSHAHDGSTSHDHHATLSREFALPSGMSYDDLSNAVRDAFINANPGADSETWVSDLYDDSVIVCMDGRYWQQAYTIDRKGTVSMTGSPSEVSRVTEWRSVAASRGLTYVDNAERVLADVRAFLGRTADLARLRASEGRKFEKHRDRLVSLRDGLRDMTAELDGFIENAPPEDSDYARVLRGRLRLAELRRAELTGA